MSRKQIQEMELKAPKQIQLHIKIKYMTKMGSQITKAKIVNSKDNKWDWDNQIAIWKKIRFNAYTREKNKFQKDQRPEKVKLHSMRRKHEWILSNFRAEKVF